MKHPCIDGKKHCFVPLPPDHPRSILYLTLDRIVKRCDHCGRETIERRSHQ